LPKLKWSKDRQVTQAVLQLLAAVPH